MKTNTIAAWVFSGLLAVVGALNAPLIADRVNGWMGKDTAPEEQTIAAAPAETEEPDDAGSVTGTGDRPTAAETPSAGAQDRPPEVAALSEGEETAMPAITVPGFGLLRVEPDGSTVIAGQAGSNARIEVLSGEKTIAETVAEANGDFVAVVESPLAPGDYQIVLRATQPNGDVAMSTETAIISVPEKGREGDLLALVEQPGEPSRLINTPKPAAAGTAGDAGEDAPETAADAATAPDDREREVASAEPAAEEGDAETKVAGESAPAGDVRIDAVEIDGETVFVAGAAKPGSRLRVYANDILLGDTVAGPNGRFLVEVQKELPVGDYIVRADVIAPGTADVVARAAVPFTRDEGERLAAVAAPGAGQGAVSVPEPSSALPENPPSVSDTVTVTGRLQRTDSSVIIRRGDTLWHISRRIYGQGDRYTTIYLANQQQIKDPDRIWPGQIFTLPKSSDG